MVKKNKNTKILLPIVIAIWGLLIYQIIDAFGANEVSNTEVVSTNYAPKMLTPRDTFSLKPIERDPFLGISYVKQITSKKKTSKKTSKLVWPAIEYKGTISGGNKNSIFIININNEQHLLKRNDTIAGLRLVKGNTSQITLRLKGVAKNYQKI